MMTFETPVDRAPELQPWRIVAYKQWANMLSWNVGHVPDSENGSDLPSEGLQSIDSIRACRKRLPYDLEAFVE